MGQQRAAEIGCEFKHRTYRRGSGLTSSVVIDGGGGNDKIYGYGGSDTLCGGAGDDYIAGDEGLGPAESAGGDGIQGGFGQDQVN
ncbi:MAG: hypothetical protein ACJ758_04480, partial [Actinomycetota bacterium]